MLRPLIQTVRRYTDSVCGGFPIAPGFSRGECLPSTALAGEGKCNRREGPIFVTPG